MKIYILLILVLLQTTFLLAKDDFTTQAQPRVVEAAQKIEPYGELKQKENGYLYVAVSREFISHILPMIQSPKTLKATGHCTSKKGIGPHISVITDSEVTKHKIGKIAEIGNIFQFRVKELRSVKVRDKKLWLLACESPELEKLRVKYGLAARLQGHDFHITLAKEEEKKAAAAADGEREAA